MTALAVAWVDVMPRTDKFEPGLKRQLAKVDASKEGRKVGGTFSAGMKNALAGAAGAIGTTAVVALFKSAISGASDLSETVNKSNVIFGKNAGVIDSWAKGAAKSLGLSRQQALEAATGFGQMFIQLGFGGAQATKMSQKVVQLSADLGSFNNLPTAEVSAMISAAFRGEYDSLQRLVPTINAAKVEQEALKETHKKSAKELTAAEKATAVLTIVQRDSAKAAGDFARTSGGLANQQKILSAQFSDLRDTLGTKLLPVMVKIAGVFLAAIGFFERNRAVLVPLVAVFGSLVGIVFTITKAVKAYTAVQAALNVVMAANPIGIVIIAIAALVAGIIVAYKKSETFRAVVKLLWEALKQGALTAVGIVLKMFDVLLAGISGLLRAFGHLPGPLGKPFRDAADKVDAARGKVIDLQGSINSLKGKTVPVTVNIKGRDVTPVGFGTSASGQPIGIGSRAFGGPIGGYAPTDRADNRLIRVTPGEWVIQKPTVDRLERQRPGIMAAINAGQVDVGGDAGAMRLAVGRRIRGQKPRGYAAGGLIAAAQQYLQAQVGEPYIWGGVGPFGGDCSGYVGNAYGILTGRNPNQRYFTTASIGSAQGFRPGRGTFTVGVTAGSGHMAGNLAGMKFEATPPRLRTGAAAAPVTSFARQFYLPQVGGAFSGAGGGAAGGVVPGMSGAQVHRTVQLLRPQIVSSIFKELGVRQYDGGGTWPSGTAGVNTSGQPETVTTGPTMAAVIAELQALRADLARMPDGVGRAVGTQLTKGGRR